MRAAMCTLVALGGVLSFAPGAHALVYPVTSTADSGPSTLRNALDTANGTPVNDTIDITAAGTINLASSLSILAATATGGTLTIAGPGADRLTLRRNAGTYAIFTSAVGSNTTISGITVSNGNGNSGGIFNRGIMSLGRVELTGNTASGAGGGISNGDGTNSASLTIDRSTIAGNTSTGAATGGGIYNNEPAALIVNRSTIANNTSTAGTVGGGIVTFDSATISSSTIAGNTVGGGGAADGSNIFIQGAAAFFPVATLRDTIVADPLSSPAGPVKNCDTFNNGSFASTGFNLADDASCNLTQATDQPTVDPGLGALSANRGPTRTLLIPKSSPAVDRGSSTPLSDVDQRGFSRVIDFPDSPNAAGGDGSDIGAVELQAAYVPSPCAILGISPTVTYYVKPTDRCSIPAGPQTNPDSAKKCKKKRKKGKKAGALGTGKKCGKKRPKRK